MLKWVSLWLIRISDVIAIADDFVWIGLVAQVESQFSPRMVVFKLGFFQKLFPFFTVANQLISQLDFSLFDFSQVNERPDTIISERKGNEDWLNQVGWNDFLLLWFVDL